MSIRVLLVDDDKSVALVTSELLIEHGYEVDTCHDGAAALHRLSDGNYDVAVLDLGLPMFDGKELFANIKTAKLETQVIFVTGNAAIDIATKLMREGAFDYLVKPVKSETLIDTIEAAIASRREKRNRDLLLKKLAKRSKSLDAKVEDARRATESEKTKSAIILDTLQQELEAALAEVNSSKEALQSANDQRMSLEAKLQEVESERGRLQTEVIRLQEKRTNEDMQKYTIGETEQALLCEAAAEVTALEDKVDELQGKLRAYQETRDSYSVQASVELATLREAASFMPRSTMLKAVIIVCCLAGLTCLAVGAASGKLVPIGPHYREMRTALAGQAVLAGLVALVIVLLVRLLSVLDYLQLSLGQEESSEKTVTEKFLESGGTICVAMSVTLMGVALFVYSFGATNELWQQLSSLNLYAIFTIVSASPHRDLGVLALVGAAIFLIGAALTTTMRISSAFYNAMEKHTERATTLERLEVL